MPFLPHAGLAALRAKAARVRTLRRVRRRYQYGVKADLVLSGRYLVTTELGVFLVESGEIRQLTDTPGFGVAIDGDDAFLSYEAAAKRWHLRRSVSRVARTPLSRLLAGRLVGTPPNTLQSLYDQPFRSTNGRIHQIRMASRTEEVPEPCLLIAATEENAVVVVSTDGSLRGRLLPFTDRFGAPIRGHDHNHINSVLAADGTVFLVAYKAAKGASFIGYLEHGELFGWQPSPRGFHDLETTARGFLTSDTFGRAGGGHVLNETSFFQEPFFNAHDLCPRGIAQGEGEVLIGHSHKGERKKRFAGSGGLIVCPVDRPPCLHQMPWAQTYDILALDGQQDVPAATTGGLRDALTQRLGPAQAYGPYVWEPASSRPGLGGASQEAA
jgi:hypothetical protein